MSGKTVTRADLYEMAYKKFGLTLTKSATLVELVLKEITHCLERGETVKLSSFGLFVVRKRCQRMARNPVDWSVLLGSFAPCELSPGIRTDVPERQPPLCVSSLV